MKITSIRASAGRTLPHPNESYSNMKFFVELSAELKAGEDANVAAVQLQEVANGLMQAECMRRLADIERQEKEERERREAEYKKEREIRDAERAVSEAQRKLDRLKNGDQGDDIPF